MHGHGQRSGLVDDPKARAESHDQNRPSILMLVTLAVVQ
jgi:hypothetical protein